MRKNRLIRSQFPGQSAVTEHEPEETETPEESEVVAEEPAEMEDENEKNPDISITPDISYGKEAITAQMKQAEAEAQLAQGSVTHRYG